MGPVILLWNSEHKCSGQTSTNLAREIFWTTGNFPEVDSFLREELRWEDEDHRWVMGNETHGAGSHYVADEEGGEGYGKGGGGEDFENSTPGTCRLSTERLPKLSIMQDN